MTDRIFEQYAPIYWNAGLPVIPLRQRNKMPDINQWSLFSSRMPTESEQAHWLASYPKGNIGLPLGPASGLCMIDIDTEDEALVAAIREILPPTPWVRVGKKGRGLAYRFEGQKNFKLRGEDGGMILEFLGQGNQMVMPPSIHPDTGMPYVANANLWDVLDQVEYLGEDIEDKLRGLLGAKGFSLGSGGRSAPLDVIPAGERDVQMIRQAGYLARVVLGIDKSASFSLYEAIQHIYTWVESFTAKVSGDEMDPNKGVAKLLEFLLKDLEKGRTLPVGWDAGLPSEWEDHPTIMRMRELNQSQRWDFVKARDWFAAKIAEKPDDISWHMEVVQAVLRAVAKDENFTELELRSLVSFIMATCGKELGFKKTDLMQVVKMERKGVSEDGIENHAKIAEELLEQMQKEGEIRYDKGKFWQWNGSCFKRYDEEDVAKYVMDNVTESMITRTWHGYQSVVNVMKRMVRRPLESEERGVNFANGFVGEDLRVVEHDPKYGCTFTLPFEYDGENASRCNRWLEFLADCWGHEPDFGERIMALQEMFAATLFGLAPQYQRAFLLFGKAGTGKTQVLRVLRALLPPDTVASLGPEQWDRRFATTALVGARANIVGELPERGVIAGNIFKEIVEGSPIQSEYKGVDVFVFVPESAHWFATNQLPISSDSSRGFTRRWLILDFGRVVPEKEQVKNLAEQIVAEERDAIAAWALGGLRRLIENNGYTLPECHERRVKQLRRLNNSVEAFLEDTHIVSKGEGEMPCKEVYDTYVFHHKDLNSYVRPVSYERFVQMLEELGFDMKHAVDVYGAPELRVQGLFRTKSQ